MLVRLSPGLRAARRLCATPSPAQYYLSTEQPGLTGQVLHPAFLLTYLFSSLPQNCSVAVCQRIQCAIPSFGIQEEFKVTLKSNFSFDWYIKVCEGPRLGWA